MSIERIREALADPALFDEGASVDDTLRACERWHAANSPEAIRELLAERDALKAENERLTADRSRLLNAARRAVTALAAAAERTPEFQRDYEMLAGSLAPFRGEWPKEQR